ncbi:transcription regulator protein BACH1 [Phyllostomus hastatus]|uniref:transcription regulator protein BACH1 n=1 Tax=Phyllostomus hastatus TaxID=9423 RepID=UPI001E684FB5|nr:transcription regulator protein BACH1 [Phyllostomus hastatus]XP_045708461.1 transcription regulator protein BACH1 [Phyllostomus hastatus]XP_045708462.1 transcription regulator protein BACH1 [Phyllostomus hastatus]XP_045708463.1 transcription regulator protein BACH1 [Phyllostomus hastatus]XP_045708464.1 transcription regulator protein BACH1 [Phyllostomus hastatus]
MSLSEGAAFAYESSVHSTNVLLGLDEQRKRGLLCDATVLVQGRPFRAHRSVLAACSSYFHARVVGQADATELRISLPEEVTVKGFEPLLQFAYTARLLLSKDNVDEVCRCVDLLGVHDIEESCFQFLKFKSLDPSAEQQECPRQKCFPPHCQNADLKFSLLDRRDADIDEVEEFWRHKNAPAPQCQLPERQGDRKTPPPLQDGAGQTWEAMCLGKDAALALPSLCPKYRKFQKAFGTDRVHPVEPGFGDVHGSLQPGETPEGECAGGSRGCAGPPAALKCEEGGTAMERADAEGDPAPPCPPGAADAAPLPHSSCADAASPGLYSLPLLHTYGPYGDLSFAGAQGPVALAEKPESGPDSGGERACAEGQEAHLEPDAGPGEESGLARSSVEREVAEHLAKGFWTDVCGLAAPRPAQAHPGAARAGAEQAPAQRRSECPWLGIRISESPEPGQRTFATLSPVSCPFMSTLGAEGRPGRADLGTDGYASEPQQGPCPYACVITLGDDSETDTEGDSEPCSAREQECEVKLPFNAQRIISLSRNDFQSLLKMHKLTPEQLDCIHDIRRRSKNRIAAQRCRKRKLDCIQNLESEIEKLQSEKESLLKERDHILSTLGETKQNLTGLCQQVCKEAALSQEQIQILAKYSASDCPLSFLVSEKGRSASDGAAAFPPSLSVLEGPAAAPPAGEGGPSGPSGPSGPGGKGSAAACTLGQEPGPPPQAAREPAGRTEPCRPGAGLADVCQQMTDKCTTDE